MGHDYSLPVLYQNGGKIVNTPKNTIPTAPKKPTQTAVCSADRVSECGDHGKEVKNAKFSGKTEKQELKTGLKVLYI